MAIHRQAVSPPVASDEVASIRTELSPRYGAKVQEEGAARVLMIRVPRGEPDPVNDVEAAIEYLQPADVKDITHCLLIGDQRVAQVYARPLVDLMQQRVDFDRRQAAAWRERMPGLLGHALYQSPEDPRRRWRLAVRLPVQSIKEMDEEMLEDLADGLGPELETPRFRSLVAVYLIAAEDDVRLEPDLFVQELLSTWQDEDRRRRLQAALARKEEEDRRRKERERAALLRDMERRVGQRTTRAPLRRAPLLESETTIKPKPEVRHVRRQIDRLASGPWAASEAAGVIPAGPRGGATNAGPAPLRNDARPGRDAMLARDASQAGSHARDPTPHDPGGQGRMAPIMAAAEELADTTRQRHDEAQRELGDLRSRVDRALDRATGGPDRPGEASMDAHLHDGSTEPPPGGQGVGPGRGPTSGREGPGGPGPGAAGGPLDRARIRLEDAGFQVLVRPDTPGHVIDLAGERPDGDPQRIVVRIVERLDTTVAKELLRTARELDVDLVLCVAGHVEPEGRRVLVATKVKAVTPDEMDRLAF